MSEQRFRGGDSKDNSLGFSGRVLITGGAGFLGRHLCAALVRGGCQVTILDDLSAEGSSFDHPELQSPGVRLIRDTTNHTSLLRELVSTHQGIVHFASVVGVEHTMANPIPTIQNLTGTIALAQSLTPEHFVLFASSADVYGLHSHMYTHPMHEDDLLVLDSSPSDRWTYARVKSLEESLIMRSPARSVIARVFNSYGPRMDYGGPKRLIPQILDALFRREPLQISGNGSQRRALCFVDDSVRCLELALWHAYAQAAPYTVTINAGHDETRSVLEIAKLTAEAALEQKIIQRAPELLLNAKLYSRDFDDSWHRVPDLTRARDLLGFRASVPFSEGIRRTLLAEAAMRAA